MTQPLFCVALSFLLVVATITPLRVDAAADVASDTFGDEELKCIVCVRSIEHIWTQGANLRTHCALRENHHRDDDQCRHSHLTKKGIVALANSSCADLTESYQAQRAADGSGLVTLTEHKSSSHSPEQVAAIQASCERWVHDRHTVEEVARYIYANLDAQKTARDILYSLQQRFCKEPCNLPARKPRKPKPPHHVDEHHDWSRWADPDAHELDHNFENQHPGKANGAHVRYHETGSHYTMDAPKGMKNVRRVGQGGRYDPSDPIHDETRRKEASKTMEDSSPSGSDDSPHGDLDESELLDHSGDL